MKAKNYKFAFSFLMIWSLLLLVVSSANQSSRQPATTLKPVVEFEIIKTRDLTRAPAIQKTLN